MKFKRFLSSVLAVASVVSMISVSNAFAAEPVVVVGNLVDALTGAEVTELKAGQIVEAPVDITNVDTGKLSGVQIRIHYDKNVLTPGIDTTDESSDGYTYYGNYTETLFAMDPTREKKGEYVVVARNNMQGRTKGAISGNLTAGDGEMAALWTITGASSVAISDSVPEFYIAFTVNSDFDSSKLALNYGSNNLGEGLYSINTIKIDETTTINHFTPDTTQAGYKANACAGAFKLVLDNSALNYWVQSIEVFNGDTSLGKLTEYTNADGSTEYAFPARVYATGKDSANITIKATVSDDEAGTKNTRTVTLADNVTIDLTGTVTDYAAVN